ncbi:MAG TPA: AMP-binding protein [Acidobacteriota bacterium]
MPSKLVRLIEVRRRSRADGLCFRAAYRPYRLRRGRAEELLRRSSGWLEDAGLKAGDRMLLWGPPRPEWALAFLGALRAGIVAVPLDEQSPAPFIARVQSQAHAKLLLHGARMRPPELAIRTCDLERFAAQLSSAPPRPPADLDEDALAEIVFTSGTTAEPKGVLITHRNLESNLRPVVDWLERRPYARIPLGRLGFMTLVPWSHLFGQVPGLILPWYVGAPILTSAARAAPRLIEQIRAERISVVIAVPRQLELLAAALRARDRSGRLEARLEALEGVGLLTRWWRMRDLRRALGWRMLSFVVGGAALDPEIEAFFSRLGYAVVQGYGLTEAAPMVAFNLPWNRKRGALGQVFGPQEVRVSDSGELWVKGENVSPGYLGTEDRPVPMTEDGWLRTGDKVERGEDGRLYYRGRSKEVIVLADGMNVYPGDVEAALRAQTGIRDAAVVAVGPPSAPKLHAALLMESESDPGAAAAAANAELAPHQRIQDFTVWPEPDFPRTPTLKVKRVEVERALTEGGRPSSEDDSLLSHFLSGRGADAAPESRLGTELGLSSLDRVELHAQLESALGRELPETALTENTTLAELKQLLSRPESAAPAAAELEQLSYPRWALHPAARLLRSLGQWTIVFPLLRLWVRVSAQGLERLQSVQPPVLFAANHTSMFDAVVVARALPPSFRARLAIAMMGEYALRERGFWRLRRRLHVFLTALFMNAYPFPQTGAFRRALEYTGELIDGGFCPLVFPEGGRTVDGRLQPFREGIGLIAAQMQPTIVPVYVAGLLEVLPKHARWPRRGRAQVTFGAPIPADELVGDDPKQLAKRVEQAVLAIEPTG